jgi:hypothetical protein
MPHDPNPMAVADARGKNPGGSWDSAWDSHGTAAEYLSHVGPSTGTAKATTNLGKRHTVPLSRALGSGTPGQPKKCGTTRGTLAGQHDGNVVTALRSGSPELVGGAQ